jgi:ubiquinone/menaquinone biosynthesis C-methylase UbiE
MYDSAMTQENEREQHDRVRERFTRTAEQFASFALSERRADIDQLVELAAPQASDRALDVACGPGTFALGFAPRVRTAVGLDFTPALVAQGRVAATNTGLANVLFVIGDALVLPFPSGSFDIVACGYSLHHMPDPAAAVREFARVARPGGRVVVADIFVPAPGNPDAYDAIERARDASHTHTLGPDELPALLRGVGLRVRGVKRTADSRSFNRWMSIAGWKPGDEVYRATRRLMEESMEDDKAGFHPRPADGKDDVIFVHNVAFVVAEKA